MKHFQFFAAVVLLTAGRSVPTAAFDSEDVQFNAHFTQAYTKTRNFRLFPTGGEKGDWRPLLYALQLTTKINDRIDLRTEMESEDAAVDNFSGLDEKESSMAPEIIVAAARFSLSDETRLGIGLQKLPFGLYNGVRNVGIAYPMVELPFLYQSLVGFTQENFRGLDLRHSIRLGDGNVQLVGYFGSMRLKTAFDTEGHTAIRIDPVNLVNNGGFSNLRVKRELNLRNLHGGQVAAAGIYEGLTLQAGMWRGYDYQGMEGTDGWRAWNTAIQFDHRWFALLGELARVNDAGEIRYGLAGVKPLEEILLFAWAEHYTPRRNRTRHILWESYSFGAEWHLFPEVSLKAEVRNQTIGTIEVILDAENQEPVLIPIPGTHFFYRSVMASLSVALF